MVSKKTTLVLWNPKAGSGEAESVLKDLCEKIPQTQLREATGSDQMGQLANDAAARGIEQIVVAGGDGSIHAVVNALADQLRQVILGILPLGTGNDFARNLKQPSDVKQWADHFASATAQWFDLIEVQMDSERRYCLNLAAGGFSGQVEEEMSKELKERWGPLSYLRAAAGVLPDRTCYRTRFEWEDGESQVDTLNVVVANGKYVAKGFEVSPTSDPQDGSIEVVGIRFAPLLDLAAIGAQLLSATHLEHDQVFCKRVKKLSLSSQPSMPFSLDGEAVASERYQFHILPKAVRFLVGSVGA